MVNLKVLLAVGGLMLMRCPIEVKEDRDEYFANLTKDQQQSVDNDLMKESTLPCQSQKKGNLG